MPPLSFNLSPVEEKLLGAAQYFYIHVEKRGLPLEASKALVNYSLGSGSRNIAISMLERTKKHLPLWIEDSSQVQIYKRFFGYISKREELNLAECFSPFVLVGAWESFYDLLIKERSKRRDAFSWLKDFFESLQVEDLREEEKPTTLFEKLLERIDLPDNHSFFVATHVAYMMNPHAFIPISKSTGNAVSVDEPGAYFRLVESTRRRRIKPIEVSAFLHLLYEKVPSKRYGAEMILGIDRELELLKKAEKLWGEGEFYEAHEILEEVWEYVKDPEKRECYQGVIRFAIALYHYQSGEFKKAQNVLKKALPQMKNCKNKLPINLRELAVQAEEILHRLKEGSPLGVYPPFRVV